MTEQQQKAFDFAGDTTKQLIALSTGVLALTITFATDILEEVPDWANYALGGAWILYLLAMGCGVFVLWALTGELDGSNPSPSISGSNVLVWAIVQGICFLLATLLVVVLGIGAI